MIQYEDVKLYVQTANELARGKDPNEAGREEATKLGIDYDSLQEGLEREAGPIIGPALFNGIVIGVALARSKGW